VKVETKFSLGDTVHVLRHSRIERVTEPCPTCKEAKAIVVEGESFTCPKCEGRGHLKGQRYAWYVELTSTVGQVSVCTRHHSEITEDEPWEVDERYMLHATGVGSGTTYGNRNDLWGGTREEAQAEAERRNRERTWP
jgi:hypothetical protein